MTAHNLPLGQAHAAEYRLARLQQRLAEGAPAQLGLCFDLRGDTVLLTGTVPDPACREAVLAAVAEELDGLRVHADLAVADASPPTRAEDVL